MTGAASGELKVSPLELFFDLVFAFTLSQVSSLMERSGAEEWLKAAVVMNAVWYLYDGYTWLCGNRQKETRLFRISIFGAMLGFLLQALAFPTVFGEGGLLFAAGYTLTVAVYMRMYTQAGLRSAAAPFYLAATGLIVAAGFLPEEWDWPLWIGVTALLVAPYLLGRARKGLQVRPGHFVERQGLILLIALGENVVAIGLGAQEARVTWTMALTSALALALAAAVWWSYFARDPERAVAHLRAQEEANRTRMGFGISWAHFTMLLGIVTAAAGVAGAITGSRHPESFDSAWSLGIGVALYLEGEVLFRRCVGIGFTRKRLVAAGLALATVPVGLLLSGQAQIATLAAVIIGMLAWEQRRSPAGASSTAPSS